MGDVIFRTPLRKIKEAARELSKEERDLLVSGERRHTSSPWAVRRSLPLPDRVETPPEVRTPSPRDGAALERAKRLRQGEPTNVSSSQNKFF
jgi:hypothetical protein